MFTHFRSMVHTLLLSGTVIASVMAVIPGQAILAGGGSSPLILHIGMGTTGDLWSVSAPGVAPVQMTNWRYNYSPVLSPDGDYVAFLSTPTAVVNDIAANGARSGVTPANVWIMHTFYGYAVRVADQPTGASYDKGGFIMRPTPAWSPDSKHLAWLELSGYDSGKPAYQLVAYDVSDIKAPKNMFAVKAPGYELPAAGLSGETVSWSAAGIGYTVTGGTDPATGQMMPSRFYLYDTLGALIMSEALADPSCGIYGWVTVDQPRAVLCSFNNSQTNYVVLKPHDKTVMSLADFGVLKLMQRGELGVHHLTWVKNPTKQYTSTPYGWQLDDHTDIILNDPVAISPDGLLVVTVSSPNSYTVYNKSDLPYTATLNLTGNQRLDWVGWGPTELTSGKG